MRRIATAVAVVAATIFPAVAHADETAEPELITSINTNWTYTYLKANDGNLGNLKEFLELNWLEMDRVAVDQGLFRDYQIIENLARRDSGDQTEWDFIVAVEYYGDETYADIAEAFSAIRTEHVTQMVEGKGLRELGRIVRSEVVRPHPVQKFDAGCDAERFDLVKPFLGVWDEFDARGERGYPSGVLEFQVNPRGCSFEKRFDLHHSDFSYTTQGTYRNESGTWSEAFTFSNGRAAKFEWVKQPDGVFMYNRTSNPAAEGALRRNQWTYPVDNEFRIIQQVSEDGGQTWQSGDVTLVRRRS